MAKERNRYRRGRRSKNRGFASWSLGKKIGIILGGTMALVAVTGAVIVASKLSKIDRREPTNAKELNVSEEARERGTGYLNVALFGVDSRKNEMGKGTRSDSIMIASLNRETLEIKISSIFRDTLLEQEDDSITKANAAYSYGGPEGAVAVLNKNLDMDIEHYVTVNFDALIDVVDAVGGVEIDVTDEEVQYVNGYSTEIKRVTGKDSPDIAGPGLQVLDGIHATAYTRIRYTAGDDFKRAERQRTVLTKIVENLQKASPAQMNQIMDYAKDAFEYRLMETVGFPFDKTTDELMDVGSVVIPVTLASNVEQLHNFFYGESEAYSVSSTVSSISDRIVTKAGNRTADVNEATQQIMNQPDDEDEDYNSGYSNGGSGNSGYSSGGSTSGGGTGGSTGGDSFSGGGTSDNDPDTSYTPDVPSGGGDSGESDYIE